MLLRSVNTKEMRIIKEYEPLPHIRSLSQSDRDLIHLLIHLVGKTYDGKSCHQMNYFMRTSFPNMPRHVGRLIKLGFLAPVKATPASPQPFVHTDKGWSAMKAIYKEYYTVIEAMLQDILDRDPESAFARWREHTATQIIYRETNAVRKTFCDLYLNDSGPVTDTEALVLLSEMTNYTPESYAKLFEVEINKETRDMVYYQRAVKSSLETIRFYQSTLSAEKYVFLSVLDIETCDTCIVLDGQTFSASDAELGVNFPPMHLGCRCTITPYFPSGRWGERVARDPITGKTVYTKEHTFADWYQSFSDEKKAAFWNARLRKKGK